MGYNIIAYNFCMIVLAGIYKDINRISVPPHQLWLHGVIQFICVTIQVLFSHAFF